MAKKKTKEIVKSENNLTINYNYYLLDRNYKQNTNFINTVNEDYNFFIGKQYPNDNYGNMLRVTMNICNFDVLLKAAKVCGTPIYFTYTADNPEIDCTPIRRFDEYNCNKIDLNYSNYQAAINGFALGTEITYILWDDDDMSYKGIYKGGLREEHIDIKRFAVANKFIQDIQNQEWVMWWKPVPLDTAIKMCEIEDTKNLLRREDNNNLEENAFNSAYVSSSVVNLYTRFFRVDGEVYFMCSTDKYDLFKFPHPMSRKLTKERIKKAVEKYIREIEGKEITEDLVLDYDIDAEDVGLQSTSEEAISNEEYAKENDKFSLYPFAVFVPYFINDSFYGRSEISQLKSIQKGINFLLSMMIKCSENNAYNKIFAKPDALLDQEITNEPSQVIFDYSQFTNGWGIKFAESQPMPNGLFEFANNLLGMTRVIYGFNDVMDGSSGGDLSGYLFNQMVKQANTSIEQQQKLFWKYNVDKAAIRLQYYKHYVGEAKYTYVMDDIDYRSEEEARLKLKEIALQGNGLPTNPNALPQDFENETRQLKVESIRGEDLYGNNFDISIDALQGLNDSEYIEQQMWDNLLLNGGLQNIQPEILEMYLEASPNVSERSKTALKKVLEQIKKSENERLRQELNDLTEKTSQIIDYAKQLENRLGYQSELTKNLRKEFEEKINASNNVVNGLMKDLEKYRQNYDEGQVKSNNSKGIKTIDTAEQPIQ